MMYVVQTKTGCELSSGVLLKRLGFNIKIPEKLMSIRRGGIWRLEKKLVFTGYIFLESDKSITEKDYYKVKNTDGVINFIGKGKPQEIREKAPGCHEDGRGVPDGFGCLGGLRGASRGLPGAWAGKLYPVFLQGNGIVFKLFSSR